MRRTNHAFIGVVRDQERGYMYWQASCKCGFKTVAGHLTRAHAFGALMEHIVTARVSEYERVSS